jgi:hypothetical protein
VTPPDKNQGERPGYPGDHTHIISASYFVGAFIISRNTSFGEIVIVGVSRYNGIVEDVGVFRFDFSILKFIFHVRGLGKLYGTTNIIKY